MRHQDVQIRRRGSAIKKSRTSNSPISLEDRSGESLSGGWSLGEKYDWVRTHNNKKRKVHFTHLWFGLFTLYLLVISNLTLCLPEYHFLPSVTYSLTAININKIKTKENKNSQLSSSLSRS